VFMAFLLFPHGVFLRRRLPSANLATLAMFPDMALSLYVRQAVGFFLVAVVWGGAFVLSGCKSPEEAKPKRFASVVIEGNTRGQIAVVVASVFQAEGYKVVRNDLHSLRFERVGSKMDTVAYGNWMGGDVWTRVDVTLEELGENKVSVECQAYHVRDPDRALEETIRMGRLHAKPYQKLLDQVAARFAR
jgi:hypothetical protein